MISDEVFDLLIWNKLKVDELKDLQGALIEDIEPTHIGYTNEQGEPAICGVTLYIKDRNGNKRAISFETPEPPNCVYEPLDMSQADIEEENQ